MPKTKFWKKKTAKTERVQNKTKQDTFKKEHDRIWTVWVDPH